MMERAEAGGRWKGEMEYKIQKKEEEQSFIKRLLAIMEAVNIGIRPGFRSQLSCQ